MDPCDRKMQKRKVQWVRKDDQESVIKVTSHPGAKEYKLYPHFYPVGMASRIMVPKNLQAQIPRTCDYLILYLQKDFKDAIKFTDFQIKNDYPDDCNLITGVLES